MTGSCPIAPAVVDDRATRIGAALTILIVLAGLKALPINAGPNRFAALEAFLGFCVGCKVNSLLQPLFGRTTAPEP